MLSAPCPWPPLISTAPHPIASNRWPWLSMAASLTATGSSRSAAASGRFGVISEARGMSPVRKRLDRAGIEQPIAGSRHHDRIEHDMFWRPSLKRRRDGFDGRCLRHHPDLDGIDVEIAENRVDLRGDEIGGHVMNAGTPRVFCAVSAVIDGRAIDAERRKRLQVGLDAGATDESEPAMVSAIGVVMFARSNFRGHE